MCTKRNDNLTYLPISQFMKTMLFVFIGMPMLLFGQKDVGIYHFLHLKPIQLTSINKKKECITFFPFVDIDTTKIIELLRTDVTSISKKKITTNLTLLQDNRRRKTKINEVNSYRQVLFVDKIPYSLFVLNDTSISLADRYKLGHIVKGFAVTYCPTPLSQENQVTSCYKNDSCGLDSFYAPSDYTYALVNFKDSQFLIDKYKDYIEHCLVEFANYLHESGINSMCSGYLNQRIYFNLNRLKPGKYRHKLL